MGSITPPNYLVSLVALYAVQKTNLIEAFHFMRNNPAMLILRGACLLISILVSQDVLRAENFELQLDSVVSPGVPGPGAGTINPSTSTDVYTFQGTNGQVVFLEEISFSPAFAGWLYWELKGPGNVTVSSAYFQGTHEGRKVLPSTGTYTVTVKVLSPQPSYVGDYSFRVRTVTADQVFPIQIGDAVSKNLPGPGAGNLDVPGANDVYQFNATAGELAFFERVSASATFKGWLQWEVKAPSGALVFRSYFGSGNDGRKVLPETGVYTVRVMDGTTELDHLGDYAFRIRAIPPDPTFAIQIGQTVTNDVPGSGAGNIEVPGAQDLYTFQGATGQNLFFQDFADASFGGWLKWDVRSPSGALIFSEYMGGAAAGRFTLPETGTYNVRCYVGSTDTDLLGTYSFKILNLDDAEVALNVGQLVTNGVPGAGAGNIEQAGNHDLYSFHASATQKIVFDEIAVANAFAGWLQMELTSPSSNQVFKFYFKPGRKQEFEMPETGTYRLKVSVGAVNPAYVGTYSFRTYSEVFARTDKFAVAPGQGLAVPLGSVLCNDSWQIGDNPFVDLPSNTTAHGGTITTNGTSIVYMPSVGFTGWDSFVYRLNGKFGDDDTNVINIAVAPAAPNYGTVVSLKMVGPTTVAVCLHGTPSQMYDVMESTNLVNWAKNGAVTADSSGAMSFNYTTLEAKRYYRFVKP